MRYTDDSSIVFQGDHLLSGSHATQNAPRLLSYPDDGSKPVPLIISGLPPESRYVEPGTHGIPP